MKKKSVALFLAATMVAGMLSGCGNQTSDKEVSKQESTQTSESAATSESTATSETVKESVPEEPVELTLMANFGALGPEGKAWIEELEEALNIKINWTLPATSSYEESLQLMMIDDEKPDAVLVPETWMTDANFIEACEEGMFLDISGMINDYKDIMAHTADYSWDALDVLQDGRIWGVPRSTMTRSDGFAVNEKWLEAIGFDYQEGEYLTADELFDILVKFTKEDPDGNGKNDTYGLKGYSKEDGTLLTGLNYIFGIGDTDAWAEYDGEYMCLKYSKTHSNFKDYLAFANKCWEAGVIDPDAFSIDAKTAEQRDKQGMLGVRTQFAAYILTEEDSVDNIGPNGELVQTYVPGIVAKEGDTYGFPNYSTGVWYFWTIPAGCEHPEKVLELFDYILSDEQWTNLKSQGLEGYTFTINADGSYDYSLSDKLTDDQKGRTPINVMLRRSDGGEFFINKKLSPEIQEKMTEWIDIAVDNHISGLDRGYAPEISKDAVFIEYKTNMIAEINKIITGDKPVDYWDEVLDGWYKAGGEEYVADMQAYISSVEGK